MQNRTMRELFLDAAEAVWWVVTAPLRKVVADAMQEVLDRQPSTEQPALKWSEDPEPELPLRMPPARRLAERLGIGW